MKFIEKKMNGLSKAEDEYSLEVTQIITSIAQINSMKCIAKFQGSWVCFNPILKCNQAKGKANINSVLFVESACFT